MSSSVWNRVFEVEKLELVEEIARSGKFKEEDTILPLGDLVDRHRDLRPLAYALMTVEKLSSYVKVITYHSESANRCKIDQSSVLSQIIKCCNKVEVIDFQEGNIIEDWRDALENKTGLLSFTLSPGRYSPGTKKVMFPQLFRALSRCPEIEEIYIDAIHNIEYDEAFSRECISSSKDTTRRCPKLKRFFVGHAHMLPRELTYLVALEAPLEQLELSLSSSTHASEFKPIIEEGLKKWKIQWLRINHEGHDSHHKYYLPEGYKMIIGRESRLRSYLSKI